MEEYQKIQGLKSEEGLDRHWLQRDVRSQGERFLAFLANRSSVMAILWISLVMTISDPRHSLFLFFAALFSSLVYFGKTSGLGLPLRLPKIAGIKDPGSPRPGRKSHDLASGILFLGNEADTGQEMWLDQRDMLTHCLVLGTTGSGKTQALISMAYNALAMGSGVFYIDPKSSSELPMQIWQLARFLGRDDDFRVLNYGTENGRATGRLTNTNNPFSLGAADALTQLMGSLMPPSHEGGNSVFADKALALISGLMYALVDLRDQGVEQLSVSSIRDHLPAEECVKLANHPNLGEASRASLKAALNNCNWVESRELKSQNSFFEQYGYAQSYFGKALSSLTDTYGHIYKAECGEVDFKDVVLNRRILVTLLPSMEKSPAELASLGKITLSAIRTAASVGLGASVEGHERDVLGSLPSHFKGTGPFLSVVDEYAAIVTPGFEMLLTQGRGLGLATVVASQDYAGLIEADRKGAQQIAANTTMKIFMKSDDPEKTYGLLKSLTGEAPVMRTTGYELKTDNGLLGGQWKDNLGAAVQILSKTEFQDLTSHLEGEAHCVFRGKLLRARMFYANPDTKDAVTRVHRFLQLDF
ncbi:MAG: TraM recognition domain-containing protein [Deltaproteobacteria bacterium]|jgi:intracellular multiplication protein IcmO|nr:TraM recognition domain-containing protein [Deltaproteobacteria bacterium]